MTFFSGQRARAEHINDLIDKDSVLPLGIIARGRRITNSTTTTTEVGVLRLDDVPLYAGRLYVVYTSSLLGDSSVANDAISALLRYTTDGSTPTTSSTVLHQVADVQVNAASATDVGVTGAYAPAVDELFSVLLSVARTVGTGSVGLVAASTFPIELFIEDKGIDPGDTGTDI